MADSMEPYKIMSADPCCHGNEILANLGYFFSHKISYKSACVPDRPHMFRLTRGNDQGGAIVVAMTTTFALGAESNRLPACLSVCLYLRLSQCSFKLLLLFWMESSHFLTVSSPCGTLQNFFFDFYRATQSARYLL